jgi:hypothetical protein
VLPSALVCVTTPEGDWATVLPSGFVWLTFPEPSWLTEVPPFGLHVYVSVCWPVFGSIS